MSFPPSTKNLNPVRTALVRFTFLGMCLFAISSQGATRTWDGGDLDLPGFWSARTNWNGNSNIVAGDALFFPGTALVKTMNNNLTLSNFAKLTFNDDGYTLNGNSLRLTNGITANYVPTGPTRINVGITLGDDSAFEADDSSATLELNGPVNMLGFILTNQGLGNITWLAPFGSSAGGILRKRETGTVTVRSTNANFLGTVEISAGDFVVNGRMTAGSIDVNSGGTLAGAGLVHAVTVNNSGVIAPNGAARGVLTVTNGLTILPRGIFDADILGSTLGLFDQLNVLGRVTLTNAVLNLNVNFIPASPTAITIIANDGAEAVLGTFSGLPQGATVLVTDSIRATISYTGGTGNDVVITVSPLDTLTWTGSANGLWSVGGNWVGGVAPQPGDSLVFPVTSVRKVATNDFPADTVFGLIRYETNYTLAGARVALRRGFHGLHTGSSPSVALPLLLNASQTFTNLFQDLSYSGGIELGGFGLTFRSGVAGVEHIVNSEISGAGTVTQAGAGQLILSRPNSFTGVLTAQEGVVVHDAGALGSPAQGTRVEAGANLQLSPFLVANSVLAEPLALSGRMTVAATNLNWSGNVTFEHPSARIVVDTNRTFTLASATLGTNGFTKEGPGTLRLATSQASHGGTTFVMEGTLQVDAAMTNSVLLVTNDAIVTGTGVVRQATFLAGSTFSPAGEGFGDGASSSATMIVTDSLTFQSASLFHVNVNGPSANSYDQVDVQGTVNLGAGTATLDLALGYSPAMGHSFAILDNDASDAVSGFFAGWPQGGTNIVNGHALRITYTGGTGNDIVLTRVSSPRTWTGLGANNLWSTPQNWAGNFVPTPGDRLIFPPTAARRTNQNDFAAGTIFDSLNVRGSYQLDGAEIGLLSGLFAVATNLPNADINLSLTLQASQTFALSNTVILGTRLRGNVNLGGFELTLDAAGTQPASISGTISGAGSLTKIGPGDVSLSGTNTFTGLTRVEAGDLEFRFNGPLGAASSGTVVSNGAGLTFFDAFVGETLTEPLTLAGTLTLNPVVSMTWDAPITNQGNAQILFFAPEQDIVTLSEGLHGTGTLLCRSPNFGVPVIHDIPEMRLPASNSISGSVMVQGLGLDISGTLPNASLLLLSNATGPATLTGTGLVRALTVGTNCILSPAGTNGGDGTLSTLTVTQSLVLQASAIYRVNVNGPFVQVYDQVDVLGTVNLGAGVANLDVLFGFTPLEGQTFIILDNDGADAITGTFAGKSQGAIFTVGDVRLQISYTGGTGNDIALTVLGPDELTWTGAVNGNLGTPGNWSPARSPQDGDRLIFPGGTPRRLVTNNFVGSLDLHSLRFAGEGASNNNFQVFGSALRVGAGIVVSNPVSAEFKVQVVLTAPQTLVTRGLLAFDDILNAVQGVTVFGTNTFRASSLNTGPYSGIGGTWNLTGENFVSATEGIGLFNVFLNYGATRAGLAPLFLTNGTFRLNATDASAASVLLADSLLDVASATLSSSDLLLRCRGELQFLGASRLAFAFTSSHRAVVEVAGDVRLNNATLVLTNIITAFNVPLTMIRNLGPNPVVGTFAGLPEGAVVVGPNGLQLRVSYVGGDGNDVTITSLAPVTGVTRVWSGLGPTRNWSEPANWQGLQAPLDGDSLEFPNAPQPINTNNLPANLVNQLRFTSPAPLNRVLATSAGGGFTALRLVGGLDFLETGTLRIPVTNSGLISLNGFVQSEAPQTFFVTNGGRVLIDALGGLPGAAVTKTGGGELEINGVLGTFGFGVPLLHRAGTLRVGETLDPIAQSGGTLEILKQGGDVTLFGGAFQTPPFTTNGGVRLATLNAASATNSVAIRPGGEGAVGLLTVTNGITLNSNVTLRLDVADESGVFGLTFATNDVIDFGDTGDFQPNGARLELNFLPGFNPSPTNIILVTLSRNARTNLGTFASLPHRGLLTNEFGLFRIHYRDFVLPPPFNIFSSATNHDSVILERTIARPLMVAVTNGPGAFKTVTGLGTPGALYVVEGSEDFETWTALSGETASASGRITFIDVTGLPFRFYRARLP